VNAADRARAVFTDYPRDPEPADTFRAVDDVMST